MTDPVTPYQAWNDPGRAPGWHRMMQAKLTREWPVLAKALAALKPPTVDEKARADKAEAVVEAVKKWRAKLGEGYAGPNGIILDLDDAMKSAEQ